MKRLRSGRLIGSPDAGASEALEKKVVTLQQQLTAQQAWLQACEAARSLDAARVSALEGQLVALQQGETARSAGAAARLSALEQQLVALQQGETARSAGAAARLSALEQQLATLSSQAGASSASASASSATAPLPLPAPSSSQYLSSLPFHWSELICKKFGAYTLKEGDPLKGICSNEQPFQLLCGNKPLISGSARIFDHLKFDVIFNVDCYNCVGFLGEDEYQQLIRGDRPTNRNKFIFGSALSPPSATVCVDAQAQTWTLTGADRGYFGLNQEGVFGCMPFPAPLPPRAYFYATCKAFGTQISLVFNPPQAHGVEEGEGEKVRFFL